MLPPNHLRQNGAARITLLTLFFLSESCVWGLSQAKGHHPVSACPPGTHDYGSGMVAAQLPVLVNTRVDCAHTQAVRLAGKRLSPFLAAQPFRPHVSLLYDVGEDTAASVYRSIQQFEPQQPGIRACFGALRYWDDAAGEKTALVVDVDEPAGVLKALHTKLAQTTHKKSRFAYHPHLTLAFLAAKIRLSADEERTISASLKDLCWQENSIYITNHCGQTLYTVELQGETSATEVP